MKKAFTMLELVIVIIVLGILASLAVENASKGSRAGGMNAVFSAFQYTRSLALSDMKISVTNKKWQKQLWTISFDSCDDGSIYYVIGYDRNKNGTIEKNEAAVSPVTGKKLWSDSSCSDSDSSPEVFLREYSVDDVQFSGDCTENKISFDYLGRPYSDVSSLSASDFSTLVKKDGCEATFGFSGGIKSFKVKVHPWSGMVEIEGRSI